MTTPGSITCTKCVEFDWKKPEPIVHTDGDKHYCVYHAPADSKGISVEEFNALVQQKIRRHAKTNIGPCDFSGTIFPGDIDFSETSPDNILSQIDFRECAFIGKTSFGKMTFNRPAIFSKATFKNTVSFSESTFNNFTTFLDTGFDDSANFSRSEFLDRAEFTMAGFKKKANFSHAKFVGLVDFINTYFKTNCNFRWSTFSTECDFSSAKFDGKLEFHEAHIDGKAIFAESIFSGPVDFHKTEFKNETSFALATFSETALFKQAIFAEETAIHDATFLMHADFTECSFKNPVSFRGTKFNFTSDFSWCTFSKTATFISTAFKDTGNFNNATFNGNGKFFNCVIVKELLLTDLQSVSELRFTILDLEKVNLLGTPLTNIWFQSLECPKSKNEYRYQIPQEDMPDMYQQANDFYRQMKRHHKDRQNDAEASLWHFSEKEAQLKHYQSRTDNRFLLTMLKAYRISSRYGENPLQAMKVLSWLLLALFACLLCGVLVQYGSALVVTQDHVAKFLLTFSQYTLLLRPDWTPPKGFEILTLIISRLFIPIQAALLAFAIRNKFMR